MMPASIAIREQGVVLALVLLWLVLGTLLAVSMFTNALQEQKAARSYRDRAIALQAAEAGLVDAKFDIDGPPSLAGSRGAIFAPDRSEGFPTSDQPMCQQGQGNRFQGLCRTVQGNKLPALLSDEIGANALSSPSISVEYGRFTARYLPTAVGSLPARLPRYAIELLPDRRTETESKAGAARFIYRITAIGFGPHVDTQVVLQSFYRKGVR